MTMPRVPIGELAAHAGDDDVVVAGWLHRRRELSNVTFLVIRDRSGLGQVVVTDPAQVAEVGALTPETVLSVRGRCVANERAPGGAELHDVALEILAAPVAAPPIELWRLTRLAP